MLDNSVGESPLPESTKTETAHQIKRVFTTEGVHPFDEVAWEHRLVTLKNEVTGKLLFELLAEVPSKWGENTCKIVVEKYFRPVLQKDGSYIKETSVKQMLNRVAGTLTEWCLVSGHISISEKETMNHELLHILLHQKAAYNSPVWFNVGTNMGKAATEQGSACMPAHVRVNTDKGLIPIEELIGRINDGEEIHTFDRVGVPSKILKGVFSGVKPLLEFTFSDDSTLSMTGDHIVLIDQESRFGRDPLPVYYEFEASEMSVGDYLVTPSGFDIGPGEVRESDGFLEITNIRHLPEEEVFDIQTECGTFWAEGILVHNCFISGIEDTMESLMEMYSIEGKLYSNGSGNGINYSPLRSKYEKLSNGGSPSGAVSFIRSHDTNGGVIKSGGGFRRSAKICMLNDDHGDIEEFIDSKMITENAAHALVDAGFPLRFDDSWGAYGLVPHQNANHSVRVTDAFMSAVVMGKDWDIKARDGKTLYTKPAKYFWDKICKAAWVCGDPGLQFDDTINDWHTCKDDGRINGSNPCLLGTTKLQVETGGLLSIEHIQEGDSVWTGKRFAKVLKKFNNGKAKVSMYTTDTGVLCATDNHKIMCEGIKTLIGEAYGIDTCPSPLNRNTPSKSYEITGVVSMGEHIVYDIMVDDPEHVYWADGFLVSNCSEYMFLDASACNLASINLLNFFDKSTKSFDIPAIQQTVEILTTTMDAIVGMAGYPTKEIEENSHKFRPLGIGFANLGALLMAQGIAYDSKEGRDQAGALTSLIASTAYLQSSKLADKLGSIYNWEGNKESFIRVIHKHRDASYDLTDDTDSRVASVAEGTWEELGYQLGVGKSMRNAQVVVHAPTGTISFLMGCDTTGIEPDLSLKKVKKVVGGHSMVICNEQVEPALISLGLSEKEVAEVSEYVKENNSVVGAPHLDECYYPVFDTSFNEPIGGRAIAYEGHLQMMAACQPFVSGAISKSINLPSTATTEDISKAFLTAHTLGIKAVTVYRDGCKASQPLSSEKKKEKTYSVPEVKVTKNPEVPPVSTRRKMPNDRQSLTHQVKIGNLTIYLTMGFFNNGDLGEIFIRASKLGSTVGGLLDVIATQTSFALQHGVPLEKLVNKFEYVQFEPAGITNNPEIRFAKSIPDYIFRYLGLKFLGKVNEATEKTEKVEEKELVPSPSGSICSRCGTEMRRAGTCETCPSCGSTTGCG